MRSNENTSVSLRKAIDGRGWSGMISALEIIINISIKHKLSKFFSQASGENNLVKRNSMAFRKTYFNACYL